MAAVSHLQTNSKSAVQLNQPPSSYLHVEAVEPVHHPILLQASVLN
jgi:hypothetical protein